MTMVESAVQWWRVQMTVVESATDDSGGECSTDDSGGGCSTVVESAVQMTLVESATVDSGGECKR